MNQRRDQNWAFLFLIPPVAFNSFESNPFEIKTPQSLSAIFKFSDF
jgi:hypothetical protein